MTFICISDIHGCHRELSQLLTLTREYIASEGIRDFRYVFLGDYIDRGDSSAKVIESLIDLQSQVGRCVFIRGNHEQMFLDAIAEKKDPWDPEIDIPRQRIKIPLSKNQNISRSSGKQRILT
jgi:serine/threonine protein phosphatase 1